MELIEVQSDVRHFADPLLDWPNEYLGASLASITHMLAPRFRKVYVASGYVGDQNRPVYAIRPGGKGNISLQEGQKSNEHIVWFHPQAGPYNPTPLVYGDLYYTLFDRGFFTGHDAKTGVEVNALALGAHIEIEAIAGV